MDYSYKTKGTCSSRIHFSLEEGKISKVSFEGGCNGNLQAISRLVEGLTPEELIARCGGIRCGFKNTSCADQLAQAVQQALEQEGVGA